MRNCTQNGLVCNYLVNFIVETFICLEVYSCTHRNLQVNNVGYEVINYSKATLNQRLLEVNKKTEEHIETRW